MTIRNDVQPFKIYVSTDILNISYIPASSETQVILINTKSATIGLLRDPDFNDKIVLNIGSVVNSQGDTVENVQAEFTDNNLISNDKHTVDFFGTESVVSLNIFDSINNNKKSKNYIIPVTIKSEATNLSSVLSIVVEPIKNTNITAAVEKSIIRFIPSKLIVRKVLVVLALAGAVIGLAIGSMQGSIQGSTKDTFAGGILGLVMGIIGSVAVVPIVILLVGLLILGTMAMIVSWLWPITLAVAIIALLYNPALLRRVIDWLRKKINE